MDHWLTNISSPICSLFPQSCLKLQLNDGKLPLFSFLLMLFFPAVIIVLQIKAENMSVQTEQLQPGCKWKRYNREFAKLEPEPARHLGFSCSSARVSSITVCHSCFPCWTCSIGNDEAFFAANGYTKVSEAPAGELGEYFNELKQTSKQVERLKTD